MNFLIAAGCTFVGAFFVVPILLAIIRALGLYAIVEERTCRVYVLFGKVVRTLSEPGLYFLPFSLGPSAFIVHTFGRCYVLDLRLDQEYLRSQPVNSEEGAPIGIGVWYEMFISDPVAYLFNNTDPRGSLRANISNATVRSLSNMPLSAMLENRHAMSNTVRAEVSPKSSAWGYRLGSIYVRKVHFRDVNMIRQIEEKVVNRLRQVTSAIRQDGVNQVSIITSSAEREAAIEFAKAATMCGPAHRRAGAGRDLARAGSLDGALRGAGNPAHAGLESERDLAARRCGRRGDGRAPGVHGQAPGHRAGTQGLRRWRRVGWPGPVKHVPAQTVAFR